MAVRLFAYNHDGSLKELDGDVILNDLMNAPIYEALVGDVLYLPVVIGAPDNMRRLALMAPAALTTMDEVVDEVVLKVGEARQALVDAGIARDQVQQVQIDKMAVVETNLTAMASAQATLIAQVAARKEAVVLPDWTVPASELISALATAKDFTKTVTGVKTTDTLVLTPKNLPAGYGLRTYAIPSNDTLRMNLQIPLLSLGGTAVTFGVVAFR